MSSHSKWKKQWKKEYSKISKRRNMKYNRWGYIFLIPFFLVFTVCTLIPQCMTIFNSFFTNYKEGLNHIGPSFAGLKNYITLLAPNSRGDILFFKYFGNTLVLWILGAVPQFVFALLMALIFTNSRMNIRGTGFFKTVMYMPNLIMASALSMLFYNLFSNVGPINQIIVALLGENSRIDFFSRTYTVRGLIAFMNFIMWVGNTTLVLMAGIMSIDESIMEAAAIDGAKSSKVFFNIILPLLKPIFIYTVITALLGGLQMYDVPEILTSGQGTPNYSSKTIVMSLNSYLGTSKNYGVSGAISVLMFMLSSLLSFTVYKTMIWRDEK